MNFALFGRMARAIERSPWTYGEVESLLIIASAPRDAQGMVVLSAIPETSRNLITACLDDLTRHGWLHFRSSPGLVKLTDSANTQLSKILKSCN